MARVRSGPLALVLLVLVTIVLVSVAGTLGWRSIPPRPSKPATDPVATRDALALPPESSIRDSAVVAPEPARTVLEPAPEASAVETATPSATAAPDRLAHVRVLVRAEEDGAPQAGVRVSARVLASRGVTRLRLTSSSHAAVGEVATTGSDGRASLDLDPGAAVRIRVDDDWFRDAEEDVVALSAGETIDVVLELPSKVDVRLCGQLVAEESGEPLAGTVTIPDGRRAGRTVTTTGDGRFELEGFSWERVAARAEVRDRSSVSFVIGAGYEDPTRPLGIRMPRPATLEISVRDRDGHPVSSATVTVGGRGSAVPPSPTLLLDLTMESDGRVWSASTDERGRATIRELVPTARLEVTAWREGFAYREPAETVYLAPGEARHVEIVLDRGTTVRGRFTRMDGSPVPRRTVGLMASPTSSPMAVAKTDRDGRFTFEGVVPGEWWIAPEFVKGSDIVAIPELVVVSATGDEQHVLLRAEPGLHLRGSVVDARGLAANCTVKASMSDLVHASARTEEDGTFTIGPIPAGRYAVETSGGDGLSPDPIEVDAGTSEIVLRLTPMCTITGSIAASSHAAVPKCEVALVSRTGAKGTRRTCSFRMCLDGTFEYERLAPGTYTVVARARGGWVGARTGTLRELGDHLDLGTIDLVAGGTLRLIAPRTTKGVAYEIEVDDVPIAFGFAEASGPELVCVPPGRYLVRWETSDTAEERSETVTIEAGEERVVDFGS